MPIIAWLTFVAAAVLEVSGDAAIRTGLRNAQKFNVLVGFLMLGCYGLVVNLVKWDFSKLLGVYIGVFALIAVLFGHFVFGESIPASRWIGLGVILLGSGLIQCSTH